MRPRSFDDASALEAGLEDLLRRPDPLTDPAAAPTSAAGVGGSAAFPAETFLVAGPNSNPASLAAADFVTDLDADEVEIQLALNAYLFDPAGTSIVNPAGRVVVAAGQYLVDGPVVMPEAGTLKGIGKGTFLEILSSSTAFSIEISNQSEIGDMTIGWGSS
jgi:hypothetical protein